MLMHHADVQRSCVIGIIDLNDLTVFFDHAGLRLIQAEEDAHQGRLTCAIFTKQGMNLAALELKRDIVICLDSRELLGDVQHFDYIVCHVVTPLRIVFLGKFHYN